MLFELRLHTEALSELRNFLTDADVDMDCTPVVSMVDNYYTITVVADEQEYHRLVAERPDTVEIEVLESVTSPVAPLRETPSGNRFEFGRIPRGLGKKE